MQLFRRLTKNLTMSSLHRFLIHCLLLAGTIGFQWAPTPHDDAVFYVCKGDDVTFPWVFSTSAAEEVTNIDWTFDGQSQEMVAMWSHGVFVAMPAFSGRVHNATNGGLTMSHVIPGDAGNYSVEVNIRGSSQKYQRRIVLEVHGGLQTTDGQMHVSLQQAPILDSRTGQWSLVLSCGQFTFQGEPPFPVEWVTPTSQVVSSSTYNGGQFDLHLASPVAGGTYTCRVPQQHLTSACLHGNQSAGQASLVLDKTEARFTLMEAEVSQLRRDKQQLQQQVTTLETNLTQEKQALAEAKNSLTASIGAVAHTLTSLQTTHAHDHATLTSMIQDVAIPLVGFTAETTSLIRELRAPSHIRFDRVKFNQGNGYDSSTGDFTAPVSGWYFFAVSSRGMEGFKGEIAMMANGDEVCTIYTGWDADHGTCHAVVHLARGNKVWNQPEGSDARTYLAWTTSFTGFLINDDPH